MNKIIRIALENKFTGINFDALLEVINATGNPLVATEMLLNVYEKPVFEIECKTPFYTTQSNTQFKSFDKFKDIVTYSFDERRLVTMWFRNEENALKYNTFAEALDCRDYKTADYCVSKEFQRTRYDITETCKSAKWIEQCAKTL